MIKILSIDGGGIRGIIPLVFLRQIENYTGKRIVDLFDLIGGVSSGGLISALLNKPTQDGKPQYSAAQAIEISKEFNLQIFRQSFYERLLSVFHNKYQEKPALNFFAKYLNNYQLKDSIKDLVITSFDMKTQTPFFFKSHKAKYNLNHNYMMADVARAITAAPSYFPSKIIKKDKYIYNLVDGSIFTNNATTCLYAEALKIYWGQNFFVLSLGTGKPLEKKEYKKQLNWGVLQWALPLINILFESNNDTVDYQMKYFLEENYIRFQPNIPYQFYSLDNNDEKIVNKLEDLTEEFISNNWRDFVKVCDKLNL